MYASQGRPGGQHTHGQQVFTAQTLGDGGFSVGRGTVGVAVDERITTLVNQRQATRAPAADIHQVK